MNSDPLPKSYLNYLSVVPDYRESVVFDNSLALLKKLNNSSIIASPYSSVIFLIDFAREDYLFVHKGCKELTGYNADYFLKGGHASYLEKCAKDHFEIYNKEIFPENLKFLKGCSEQQIPNLIFSNNYNLKKITGNNINILQRISFIPHSVNGDIIGVIGSITDITHFTNEQNIIHTIENTKEMNGKHETNLLYKKIYFSKDTSSVISAREKEVLLWMAEGISSKQIADKLNLSQNTVMNHRKNILRKTNTKNVAELIAHAIRNNII